ncbi:B-box zinc finger protein 21 [Spatholobus suberectus]|nr:B-box zinc finger protein 21 [Spatholobus suberectus]
MKIQCDVCHKKVASLFCTADEAALCHACDRTIHHANKLADKHKRFSLHHPTSKDTPLCDICHERRAYVFCKEDRAILCRECDLSIHGVNEHTKKHNRFLLAGVKIGAASSDPTSLISSNTTATEVRATSRSKTNRPSSLFSNENIGSSRTVGDNLACDTGSVSTSSISEYLIETIPGYCVEDLLDASFASNGFSKDYEHQSAFQNQDVQVSMCSFPLQAWVPQSQAGSPQLSTTSNLHPQIDSLIGVMEMPKAIAGEGYSTWKYNYDYDVPSISPPLIKKCRRSR